MSVSAKTFDAVAVALRCSAVECDHARTPAREMTVERDETIPPTLRRFAESLRGHPVVVFSLVAEPGLRALVFTPYDAQTRNEVRRLRE